MSNNRISRPVIILKLIASIMYLTMGVLVLFTPGLINWLGESLNYALGALLVIYGIFRLHRVITEIRAEKSENL